MTDKIPLLEGTTPLAWRYEKEGKAFVHKSRLKEGGSVYYGPGYAETPLYAAAPSLARKAASADRLAEALKRIDGEAPAKEASARAAVGFPPSRDPEYDDGNSIVEEAFEEGVARGLWIAAQIARDALGAERDG